MHSALLKPRRCQQTAVNHIFRHNGTVLGLSGGEDSSIRQASKLGHRAYVVPPAAQRLRDFR